MNERNALKYLNSFDLFKVDLRLDRIIQFLEFLGNPQENFSSIIVAGTNGKGSTASFLSSILSASGKKTGLYLSPHLRSINERIQVNGKKISTKELATLVGKMKKAKEESKSNVSFFEFLTALAFKHFAEKGCEFVVLETGMGGRLDATNVAKAKLSIITNIALEHTKYLGSTLSEIAMEKAGVIKKNTKIVAGFLPKNIHAIIEKIAIEKNAEMIALGKDFSFSEKQATLHWQEFDFYGRKKLFGLRTKLIGTNQFENASLAVAAALELGTKKESIHNGLLNASLPGRFELLRKNPLIIADVAHNPAGMNCLAENLNKFFPGKKARFVLGISSDKDEKGILEALFPVAESFILTKAEFRGMPIETLLKAFSRTNFSGKIRTEKSIPRAVRLALSEADNETPTVFTGSFFSVGQALKAMESNDCTKRV